MLFGIFYYRLQEISLFQLLLIVYYLRMAHNEFHDHIFHYIESKSKILASLHSTLWRKTHISMQMSEINRMQNMNQSCYQLMFTQAISFKQSIYKSGI